MSDSWGTELFVSFKRWNKVSEEGNSMELKFFNQERMNGGCLAWNTPSFKKIFPRVSQSLLSLERTQHRWPKQLPTSRLDVWLVASVCTPCCMLLRKAWKMLRKLEPTAPNISFVPWSLNVAQQCWILFHSFRTWFGSGTRITYGLQHLPGCILPTMHRRSYRWWYKDNLTNCCTF